MERVVGVRGTNRSKSCSFQGLIVGLESRGTVALGGWAEATGKLGS